MISTKSDRDMHHIVSKLVTYGSLGLIKSRKSDDSQHLHPSCWPLAGAQSHDEQGQNHMRRVERRIEKVNRAEARKSGNLQKITTLQALRHNSIHYTTEPASNSTTFQKDLVSERSKTPSVYSIALA